MSNRPFTIIAGFAGVAVAIAVMLSSCVGTAAPPPPESPASGASRAPAPAPAPSPAVQPADPYAAVPQAMTPVQCGQCHPDIFGRLRDVGGRHKFACQQCHERFHAFNPQKGNWAEIMPKCATCHELPHGPDLKECMACHRDPHSPKAIPMDKVLLGACASCHQGPSKDLAAFPSAHTKQGCDACHESHGAIPTCSACHQPHYDGQGDDVCSSCHPVHKPLEISLAVDDKGQTCSGCHDKEYGTWRGTPSKHGGVSCGQCHTRHGEIPSCAACHSAPHDASILARFPRCLDCHLDAHNPPVKKK